MDEYAGFCTKTPRGGGGGGGGGKCGRWNPTTEQVKVLTELFTSGLRTPTTDQIQKISSELSLYGKIESKNVFYWFQNHKARERQKRRRISVELQDNIIKPSACNNKQFGDSEGNQESTERVIETLQLFPENSGFIEPTNLHENLKIFAEDDCKEKTRFTRGTRGTEMDNPTLDLRLSFV